MYGYDKYERIFLALRYTPLLSPEQVSEDTRYDQSSNRVIVAFQRYTTDDTFRNGTSYITNNIFNLRTMSDEYWSMIKDLIETGKCTNGGNFECK